MVSFGILNTVFSVLLITKRRKERKRENKFSMINMLVVILTVVKLNVYLLTEQRRNRNGHAMSMRTFHSFIR